MKMFLFFLINKSNSELFKDFFLDIIKHKNVIFNLYEFNNEINSIVDENNENFIVFDDENLI